MLKKKFTNYKSFAGKKVDEIFDPALLEKAALFEVHNLKSGYVRNDKGKFTFVPFSNKMQVSPITSFVQSDFDGDGKIDLWQSQTDMIGSIANYFKAYGYKTSVANRAGLDLQQTAVELENGDEAVTQYPVDDNFFVITKYNNSYYYAAAVLELGAAIDVEIKNGQAKN